MKRRRINKNISRKLFRKASKVHPKNNLNPRAQRGGIRL